ncbi:MAG: hypothetical protein B6I35_06360 [Anaerolineaceae bacterium 4572_32.2]|nr:MAG: hypothetical protein B6I35_06360 [Anaerolineaceae bacterium 4572_32.2]
MVEGGCDVNPKDHPKVGNNGRRIRQRSLWLRRATGPADGVGLSLYLCWPFAGIRHHHVQEGPRLAPRAQASGGRGQNVGSRSTGDLWRPVLCHLDRRRCGRRSLSLVRHRAAEVADRRVSGLHCCVRTGLVGNVGEHFLFEGGAHPGRPGASRGHCRSYRYVRHPGYTGNILVWPCTALTLGSWWAMLPAVGIVLIYVLRTALEDRTLQAELDGYKEYTQQVRYRLLPGVW